jgi:hypothetical protein
LTTQTIEYKAKAFEPRNLAFFFLIAFGVTWFKDLLLIFGILKYPSGVDTFEVDLGSPGLLILLYVLNWGPSLPHLW